MRHFSKYIQFVALCMAVLTAASSCARKEQMRQCSGMIWSTAYNISYRSDANLDDSILVVLKKVEKSLSPFDSTSLISAINSNKSMVTDTLIRRIFLTSQEINRLSGGAFDPTVAPLVNLWGFGYKNGGGAPTDEAIDSALTHVGIGRCRLEGTEMVKCSAGTEFNFSAITKGYGCDLVEEMLRRNGCNDYMVEIGGEIALAGRNAKDEKWHIQIDAPVEEQAGPNHRALAVIEVSDCGIATSGNYRNFHQDEGGKSWHTIDPSTGRPAITETLSATVIAADCMTADALATACMAMPTEKALNMIEGIKGAEAMLVVSDGKEGFVMRTTAGFPEIKR